MNSWLPPGNYAPIRNSARLPHGWRVLAGCVCGGTIMIRLGATSSDVVALPDGRLAHVCLWPHAIKVYTSDGGLFAVNGLRPDVVMRASMRRHASSGDHIPPDALLR